MKKTDCLPILCLLLGVTGFGGCAIHSQAYEGKTTHAAPATAATPANHPLKVEVYEVKPVGTAEKLIPAVLSTEAGVVVPAPREGVVVKLPAEEGIRVSAGDELLRLNEEDLRHQLRQQELEVERLKIEEQQLAAAVRVSQTELEQETALSRDGLTSQRQLDRARYKLEGSIQEREKARLLTQTAQSKLESAQAEIQKCVIRAPINGVITQRYARVGSTVMRGDKLFEISPPGPLKVRFRLPQTESGQIHTGDVLPLSLGNQEPVFALARIQRKDPVIDAASNTQGILAAVEGVAGLVEGMAVNVHLKNTNPVNLSLPRPAFSQVLKLAAGGTCTLLIAENHACATREVTVSRDDGDQIMIASGLKAGDRVILAPQASLRAGDPIEVVGVK